MFNPSHKVKRDLLTKMSSIRNTDGGLVVQRNYTYDKITSSRFLLWEHWDACGRSAVYAGDECVTPETITEYERDAADRVLRQTQFAGVMKTEERTEYDLLGRVVKKTDAMGNVTTTSYSVNGLTSTVTQPNGATLITTRDSAGNVLKQSGTGQREMSYEYAVNATCTVVATSSDGAVLSRASTNGFGQTVLQEEPSTHGFIGTHSEYNAKNQLVKQYRDADNANVESMAPTLYEYDSFGNVVKQTVALSNSPTKTNSPMVEMSYGAPEFIDGEVYSVTAQTQYNAQGEPLTTTTKSLISSLSAVLESKQMVTDIRGNTSTTWTEYGSGAERISNQQIPTSPLPATARIVDGFTMSSRDTVGVQTSASRRYTTEGLELKQTDGRGNTTTTQSDLLGRTVSVTDAAGNTTKTRYQLDNTQPSLVVNALGYSTFSKYDLRNRKVAEYGTGVQPATFGYDDADNLTKLTTYRAAGKVISTDPSGLKGDTTTWEYDLATGLELKKTYADGKGTVKTYDAYNKLSTVTDARGVVATYTYNLSRGLLTGIDFSDDTPAQKFTYNFLGQVVSVQDASGERSISYDHYGQTNEDVQPIAGVSYALQEHWDAYGRSTGYALLKDGASQCEASTTYGALGRIQAAGFTHEGTVYQFRYGYLAGSNLLQSLVMPNGVTLTQSYEEKRDLLTGMDYVRDNSLITQRQYNYDALGRPMTRDTRYPNKAIHHADAFTYNKRSELTGALLDGNAYTYAYDNIGNREIAQEAAEDITYDANDLNQYTRISTNGEDFTPEYDADGNQTLIQTSTGIWKVQYNAQNRAIKFESEDGHTVITCGYDYMGRRFEKKVTVDGTVTLHERYIYRGYLQIAAYDLREGHAEHPDLRFIIWDPTQSVATRPLAIRENGVWYIYGWDLTKNICELYDQEGFIRTIYTYSPYGQVTAEGDVTQPIQWSSEVYDAEQGLVYYNFRYYNPCDGRWTRRDPAGIDGGFNLYLLLSNSLIAGIDYLGWEEVSKCHTVSYNKEASAPSWLLNISRSFGIHEIKGSVSISGKICEECCNRNKKGIQVSISGEYDATVEIGTPALKGLGAKFRLGWYGKTNANGSIDIDYSSCTGEIQPSLNASISIELGLVMQMSDKSEKYVGISMRGGAGLTFTPQIDKFSDRGFDISVYVNSYATISFGFNLGFFAYSFEARYESGETPFYTIPVRF